MKQPSSEAMIAIYAFGGYGHSSALQLACRQTTKVVDRKPACLQPSPSQ